MPVRSHDYWSTERWRLMLVVAFTVFTGLVTGHWYASALVALLGYIGWLLFKLRELHNWLEKGGEASLMPDSNGIWERINSHIQSSYTNKQRSEQEMSNLLKRTQKIITSLPYATIVLTDDNLIDWANNHSAQLLHINLQKDRGQRIENLLRIPEFYPLLTSKKAKEIEVTSPYDNQLKLAIHLIPIQEGMKLLIARDISERVQVQQMRKNFIANASHELRTPLTVIAGYLEIMREDEQLAENYLKAVHAASEQSTRMKHIIDDLLTLSRLENSDLDEADSQTIDITALISSICNDAVQIKGSQQTFNLEHIDPELFLQGIPLEISSVCSNLIHNAIRYTPSDSVITIIWQHVPNNGTAILSVVDNGDGIPDEQIPHLTERFYRVDKGRSQATGGTGLGLAIVQHIIKRHGGLLAIRSVVGKGSEFEVTFPANRVISPTTTKEPPPLASAG